MDAKMPHAFFTDRSSSDDWPEATPETLARLEADFPRLLKGFEDVVAYAMSLIS